MDGTVDTLRFAPRSVNVPKGVYGVIYLARNIVNGHGYVGLTTNFRDRR